MLAWKGTVPGLFCRYGYDACGTSLGPTWGIVEHQTYLHTTVAFLWKARPGISGTCSESLYRRR
jgi:hypothetical protein